MPHYRPGVDAGDPDHVLANQRVLQRAGGPPVGCQRRRVTHRIPGDPDLVAATFAVLVVPTGVADLGRSGHHDLPVITRIGQRLLIAGHAGGEHGFAQRLADCTKRRPGEDAAIFEYQQRLVTHAAPSSQSPYSPRLAARNPVSISTPDGSRHRIASIPSRAATLPAMRARREPP